MKIIKTLWGSRSTMVTFLLILVIILSSADSMMKVNEIAEQYCWDAMHQSARELKEAIETQIQTDRQLLELMAELLSHQTRSEEEEIQYILDEYRASHSLIESYELLFPDNMVFTSEGKWMDATGILSYEKEAALGLHVSDRSYDLSDKDKIILRHFVPITTDGGLTAMLCGIVNLETLPENWKVNVFNGDASFYIIARNSGDYIIDTWRKTLGNITKMEDRKLRPGYSGDIIQNELLAGKTGHVVFEDLESGEYQYFYFEPTDVNDWVVAISISESIAFKEAHNIQKIMYSFGIFEGVCFVCYFIWMIYNAQKENYEKQKQLEMVSYIYDVEKTLFAVSKQGESIVSALQRVAEMTVSEIAFFKIIGEEGAGKIYLWCRKKEKEQIYRQLLAEYHLLVDVPGQRPPKVRVSDIKEWEIRNPELYRAVKAEKIRNLMEVPVCDEEDKLVGILGIVNMFHVWENTELLDNVAISFATTYRSKQLFAKIKEMGETDYLTGLLNRNSYENKLAEYSSQPQTELACIYADANGLHEMNNTYGHECGDRMLRFVAGTFRDAFGENDTYRIGGDEFVAFASGRTEEEVSKSIKEAAAQIDKAGYHVSIGLCRKEKITGREELEQLIKCAESGMYEAKRLYYEKKGIDRRNR